MTRSQCIERTGPGQRLRDIRQASGMSTIEMADASGLSSGHISNIETGRRSLLLDSVPKVAAAYGLTPMGFVALWFANAAGEEHGDA